MLELSTPIKFVKLVGERIAVELAKRGVETVEDLLYHLPFRYEDRLNPVPMNELKAGTMASVIGEVRGTVLLQTRSMPLFEMTVGQGLSTVKCMWFRGTYLRDKFHVGQMVALYGKLEPSRSSAGKFKMIQPQFEILPSGAGADAEFSMLEVGRIVPVYESLGGTTAWGAKLGSKWLRRVIWALFEELEDAGSIHPTHRGETAMDGAPRLRGPGENGVSETLPGAMLKRLEFPERLKALQAVHFPEAGTPMVELMSATTPGHRRLIFEEFFYLELGLELKRRRMREREGTAFVTNVKVREAIKQVLPFHPTAAQKRVLGEIASDMRRPQPMRRLLQGDVGSGKTIVAMQAALVAIENGYQTALMAPTEILATQHYLSARKLLGDVLSPRTGRPYRVTLLTGSLDEATKREARGRIFRGETDLAIGTHALIEDKVDFENLGLVIVDEQHRFGVQQRFRLMKKPGALDPDVLVMTATPIPRTLALTLYGDLDASVIDELPPGRTSVVTRRTTEERAEDVWAFVRKQVEAGRQAYIVYPVIEGAKDDQPELDFPQDVEPEEASASVKAKADSSAALRNDNKETAARKKGTAVKGGSAKATRTKSSAKTEKLFEPKRALRAATDMYEELRLGPLTGLRLGLLHGRLSADDKDVTMRRFQRGDLDVLIATTVIEVGVDVPNASVMVIEHAERFGLAQMHQLRGRVGRGAAKSFCVLMTGGRVSEQAEARLDAMLRTQNGFELAELDLQQRGPGEFFGTRQAGMPEFRVANLIRDRALLELAKTEAARFASEPDPSVLSEEKDAVWARLKMQWQRKYGLVEA
ncbi:ATP-dependent DNA helicase RecG [Tunturibacter empetritectus]|uniref:Probable DNA 3'-5' helicase RecG n=1 Tax=Tunturiibacter lichenicola TaxID=2051959 RepID=A0A7W8N4A6_9BACT|nr:ATP-dependent DNA helicase RecG [Edaphobacter lichenicola]MBB5342740.1 ATP-dependent DNA helicase RecG [Edaphobacter lichenicola]